MNRKFFALLLTLLMVLALVPVSAYADTSKSSGKEIAVLFTNDVHCAVDKNLGYQSRSQKRRWKHRARMCCSST